jgi:hypothetical protein
MRHIPCSIWIHGLRVMGFWRFQPYFGHALSHCQCSKFCPKLPKFAQRRNFEIPLEIEILIRVEEALEHIFAIWIFNLRILYMSFLLSKNGLCMWILAYPLAENSLRNKNIMERLIPYLLLKVVFWPSKLCCPCRVQGKFFFWSTLNITILHTVRNECVRFGGHLDIEVSYKI